MSRSAAPAPAPGEADFISIALVNTRVTGAGVLVERLGTAGDLCEWEIAHGLTMGKPSQRHLRQMCLLRDDVRALFVALRAPDPLPSGLVGRINSAAARRGYLQLTIDRAAVWDSEDPSNPQAVIARDAILLASSPHAERLRTCAADDCDRMFLQDHGRRLWCSPQCGNRMRVRRHHARHHTR